MYKLDTCALLVRLEGCGSILPQANDVCHQGTSRKRLSTMVRRSGSLGINLRCGSRVRNQSNPPDTRSELLSRTSPSLDEMPKRALASATHIQNFVVSVHPVVYCHAALKQICGCANRGGVSLTFKHSVPMFSQDSRVWLQSLYLCFVRCYTVFNKRFANVEVSCVHGLLCTCVQHSTFIGFCLVIRK